MSGEEDDYIEEADPASFEDPIAQRAAAFVLLARFADTAEDQTAKELTYTMMRKLTGTIKTLPSGEVKLLEGGKS